MNTNVVAVSSMTMINLGILNVDISTTWQQWKYQHATCRLFHFHNEIAAV